MTAFAVPAGAATSSASVEDPSGDAPSAQVDILGVRGAYRATDQGYVLGAVVKVAEVERSSRRTYQYSVEVRSGFDRAYVLIYGPTSRRVQVYKYDEGGEQGSLVSCQGARAKINGATNEVSFSVPVRCLSYRQVGKRASVSATAFDTTAWGIYDTTGGTAEFTRPATR